MTDSSNSPSRRTIYFAIGFLLPMMLMIAMSVVTCLCTELGRDCLGGMWFGAGAFGTACFGASLIALFNDPNA